MNLPVTPAPTSPGGVEAPVNNDVAKSSSPAALEKYEVKINGQVKSLTLQELKLAASKAEGAEKRFQEASEMQKQHQALKEALSSRDVRKLASHLGVDVKEARAMMEDSLIPLHLEESMTPEEKAQYEKDKRLKEYEERDLSEKEKREKEKASKEAAEYRQQFEGELYTELKKVGMLQDPYFGIQVSQYMLGAVQQGYDIEVSEAVAFVKNKFQEDTIKVIKDMGIEGLKKYLPKDLLKQLREADVKAVKETESAFTTSKTFDGVGRKILESNSADTKSPRMKSSEFFTKLRESQPRKKR